MVTKEEINGYFLEAIRRLKAKGYTQKDIVEAAGLSQNEFGEKLDRGLSLSDVYL